MALSLRLDAPFAKKAVKPRSSPTTCRTLRRRPATESTAVAAPATAGATCETGLGVPEIGVLRFRDGSNATTDDARAATALPAAAMGRRRWLAAAVASGVVGPWRSVALRSSSRSAFAVAIATTTGMYGTAAAQSAATLREAMQHAQALRDAAVRSGDQAYGAVVLRGDEIVGAAPSRVVVANDPTAHAEMEAIRDAARRLRSRDLSGCVLVSTSRPCRMCEGAAMWAGISRMVYGDALTDAGAPR